MQTNLAKLRQMRLYVSIILSIVVVLMLVVPAFAAEPIESTPTAADNLPLVKVPVVLDGVLYQPDDFNRMHNELHAKGIYLTSVVNPKDGVFYAFKSRNGYEEFARQNGLPSTVGIRETAEKNAEMASEGSYILSSYYVFNWEHINYGGYYKATTPYLTYPNLHTEGWGDRISSLSCNPNTAEWVFEHINYGGDNHMFIGDYANLHSYGWGDRISSLTVGIY